MRRVGKGFSMVDTHLFARMFVLQQAQEVEDAAEDEDDVNETCATLTKQVANLEQDKIAQAIEITKLKRMIHPNKGEIAELDVDEDVTLEEVAAEQTKDADAKPAEVEEVIRVVTGAKLITEVVTTAASTTAAASTITAALVPKASTPRRRRGVTIQDPEEAATASEIMQSEVKSKDKGKGILVKDPKHLKRQAQIEHDEAFARELEAKLNANIDWNEVIEQVKRKERQDNTIMSYQALKRKPVTEAHVRKNMMVYLKNIAGFKMDFFKGMTYTEIRPIFEKHFNSIWAFLENGEKEIKEEESKTKSENLEQKAAKKQKIDEETEELKTHL
nr:hypothetical protein [Tanacetum cinerariifolium]